MVDPVEPRTLRRYSEWLIRAVGGGRGGWSLLAHREAAGCAARDHAFLQPLAFSMLESAMAIIFHHRVEAKSRHFIVSALLPYCHILLIGIGFLASPSSRV